MIAHQYIFLFAIISFKGIGSFLVSGNIADYEVNMEKKLRKDLLSNYDKFNALFINKQSKIVVTITTFPLSIIEINERTATMTMSAMFFMNWRDLYLMWNPFDYGGIESIKFAHEEIWHPHVIVANSRPLSENQLWSPIPLRIYFVGLVIYFVPSTFRTRCLPTNTSNTMRLTCNVIIGEPMSEIPNSKIFFFVPSDEFLLRLENNNTLWKIINVSHNIQSDLTFPTNSSLYVLTVEIERRQNFVKEVTTGPKIVVTLLALAMFWLPSNSVKKINLGCLSLLLLSAMMVYLAFIANSSILLNKSVTSLFGILFTVTSAVIMEIIVLNVPRLSGIFKPPPILIRILSGMVGRIMGIFPEKPYNSNEEIDVKNTEQYISLEQQWNVIVMALERCLFVVYLIILCNV